MKTRYIRADVVLIVASTNPDRLYIITAIEQILRVKHVVTSLVLGVDRGWIKREDDPELYSTERERKAYALTEYGRSALNAELERIQKLLVVAQARTSGETS